MGDQHDPMHTTYSVEKDGTFDFPKTRGQEGGDVNTSVNPPGSLRNHAHKEGEIPSHGDDEDGSVVQHVEADETK